MLRASCLHSFQVKNPLQVNSVHSCASTLASCDLLAQPDAKSNDIVANEMTNKFFIISLTKKPYTKTNLF